MISISNKNKQYLTVLIKLVVVFGCFYFIYNKLVQNKKLSLEQFLSILQTNFNAKWLILMIFLSFLNRFLEILKWQNLVCFIQKISIYTATKQVLAGLTAGLFTPNGIGEYAGKALYFEKDKTKKIVFLNLICNGIQLILTIVLGTIGLLVLEYKIGRAHV